MDKKEKNIRIFYSWQTDSPDETNRRLIRNSIRIASSELEQKLSSPELQYTINLDEATRDCPGSPNIPLTIFEKIGQSDVFICDLTTINANAPDGLRRTPNPNVLIELGFAISSLGFGRIIMIFNTAFGELKDLPFDIDRQRQTSYESKLDTTKQKITSNPLLVKILHEAIDEILTKNPSKGFGSDLKTPEQIKRERDITVLTEIFLTLPLGLIDRFLFYAPKIIIHDIFHFWEGFNGIIQSSSFHINDNQLYTLIKNIWESWDCTVSFGDFYTENPANPDVYVFKTPTNRALNKKESDALEKLEKGTKELKIALLELVKYVKSEYFEIDIDALNREGLRQYKEYMDTPF